MKKAKQGNWLVALSMLLSSSWAHADWTVNMREGVTALSRDVYSLHMIIFWVCVVIGVLVFGVMILSMLMHRKSLGVKPADFHHSTKLEIIWTIIPVVILVVMAIPSTATLTAMYDASDADIDIEVRGLQWKWQYTYLNDDPEKEVKFISSLLTPSEEIYNEARKRENYLLDVDNEVVIPINKKIRFLITSQDVIHAWWVPDFAVKKDAIPGFVHESWAIVEEPGIYRGQCAELCGKQHGFMPIVVRAVEQAEYEEWLVGKQEEAKAVFETVGKEWTQEELMVKGEEVYTRICSVCHQANGQGLPPAFPSLVGTGLAVGSMQEHIDIILHGKAGTAMQSFSSQLNAAEIAAVVIYERNAWGNDMGDMIQPREINEMMNGGQ
ncbi:cytochrome c oxidase subunit II [Pseudomonadales bacterium]|jgi:cytochrome c oxidase subunit 2|nr:cytochrome c oxidase subunit II [Gammaproteobacteria bacterium]MDA8880036.1 cytochrome c oxidase subunit II [Pseudomonadales bacterium]MDC1018061.1 cytochrome c oxidase subunit II [Pseudomonadales bacterium]|tara:strand:- start:3727 stop:4869 length:1143 start_codon:yes stop_codon:yes gene_type:complete